MGVELIIGGALLASKAYEVTEQRKAADAADRAATENLALQERTATTNQAFQERKYAAEKQVADVSNIRAMRQSIRQARIQAATITNSAANAGGMGSSGLAGVTSSVGAQSAGNINFMMQNAQTNAAISADMIATGRAVGADTIATGYAIGDLNAYQRQSQLNAQVGSMVGSMAGTVFGAVGGPAALAKGIDTIFTKKTA